MKNAVTRNRSVNKRTPGRAALWFGLLGGAVAWTFHILFAAIIGEGGCLTLLSETGWFGLTWTALLLLIFSLMMLGISAAAVLVSHRNRAYFRQSEAGLEDERGSGSHMAHTGLITSTTFVVFIAVQSVPIFYFLTSC